MPNVSKVAIIKAIQEAGLTPIEDSWKKETSTDYDRWSGTSTSYYTFSINTVEGVALEASKSSGDNCADFDINISNRKYENQCKELLKNIVAIGHDCNIKYNKIRIDNFSDKSNIEIITNLYPNEFEQVKEFIYSKGWAERKENNN